MLLRDRTVLVTGGASGLGGATVDAIVAAGGRAVIVDVNAEAGRGKAAQHGSSARFVQADVTSEADGKRAIHEATAAFGRIDGLVNAAGIPAAERVLGREGVQPLAHFARVVTVNLIGTFNMIRLAAEIMAENTSGEDGERGVIVNTASVAAFDGQIGQAAYSASKGGIVGMTLPIARDLSRNGIRVNTIAPGIFETPLLAALPKEAQESLGKQVPFPSRLGRPAEFAQLVKSIIENEMLNAETIRLDGAIRMAPR
jgi:NAD(P)-dependent dehydrogenase (short-subunit alcohol dehydrogenase family)